MGRQRTWPEESGKRRDNKSDINPLANPDLLSDDQDIIRGPVMEREARLETNEKDSKRLELYMKALLDGTIDRICTERESQAFKLYVIQQMSMEAVGNFMGCTQPRVTQLVQAAAVKLREEIGDVE